MLKSLLKVAVLTAFLATAAAGQSFMPHASFDFTWGGARAEAMGNAYLGLADDITAGAWNPAGLVGFEGPTLGFSYGSLRPTGFTELDVQARVFRYDHAGSLNNVSGLNFVAPFRVKGHPFVGSVNFTRNFEDYLGLGYKVDVAEFFLVERHNILELDTLLVDVNRFEGQEGGVNSVAFSFGTRVYENTSLGLGVNIYTGENVSTVHQVALVDEFPLPGGGGQLVDVMVDSLHIDTTKFSGVNFTLGLRHVAESYSAGLVIRTPFGLSLKTGSSIYQVTSLNGLPLEEGTDTTFIDNQITKYTLPLTIGAGIALNLGEQAVITADAEYRGYGGTQYKRRDSLRIDPAGNNEEYFTDIDAQWNNVFGMRFGGEYRTETSFGTIPLRAGLGLVPIPWPNHAESKSVGSSFNFPHFIFMPLMKALNKDDTPIRYVYSVGTGLHWSQIKLDWAYSYSTVDRNWGDYTLEAKVRNHHFGFTFTGVF